MMQLPVIDFADFAAGKAAQRHAIGEAIGSACRAHGFFLLANHRLDKRLSDAAFAAAQVFFDAPIEYKKTIAIENSPCHRGWYGAGGEILNAVTQPQGDLKEGLKIGRDLADDHPRVRDGLALHGPNQWPQKPEFKTAMQDCYAACEQLSRELMQAFALSLGLADDYFDRWLNLPMATLSPLRYAPLPVAISDTDPTTDLSADLSADSNTALSAAAHTDFGCLTLLLQDDAPGLEIAQPDGGWLAVPAAPEFIVVNIGDMMARWTNDIYRSTRHRVANRSGRTRHSMAFFFDPDPHADLSPLPGCVSDGDTPHYETACALDHLLAKIEDSFSYRQEVSS